MEQGSSCIISLIEAECTLDGSNSLSLDYTALVVQHPGKGVRDCACIGMAIHLGNFSLEDWCGTTH